MIKYQVATHRVCVLVDPRVPPIRHQTAMTMQSSRVGGRTTPLQPVQFVVAELPLMRRLRLLAWRGLSLQQTRAPRPVGRSGRSHRLRCVGVGRQCRSPSPSTTTLPNFRTKHRVYMPSFEMLSTPFRNLILATKGPVHRPVFAAFPAIQQRPGRRRGH